MILSKPSKAPAAIKRILSVLIQTFRPSLSTTEFIPSTNFKREFSTEKVDASVLPLFESTTLSISSKKIIPRSVRSRLPLHC